jgi:hypothetical protein
MKHKSILKKKKKKNSFRYLHKFRDQNPLKPGKETKQNPTNASEKQQLSNRKSYKGRGVFHFLCCISIK